jgi:DNA-binding response OmpR family regulator
MKTADHMISLSPQTLQLGGVNGWVDISDPECQLLRAFSASDRQRLETQHMLAMVGKAGESGKRALEVQIVRLRKKLLQAGAPAPTIKSIRSQGYQLCIPIHVLQPSV